MKIVQIVPALEQGGVETVVCDLNRVVTGNGWESVVVSKGGRLVGRIEAAGGRHVTLDVKSKNPLTYPLRVWRLRRVIRDERPDLVCVHSRVPAWLYLGVRTLDSFIRQFANSSIHSCPWLTYAHGANSISRYSAVMTKGDLTITPSRFLADYLKAHYGLAEERLRVINPAVDAKRFDPDNLDRAFVDRKRREWGLSPEDFVVMAVGRITPVKGYDNLIRAVARLDSRVRSAKLVIVGDADRRHREHLAELTALARELGLARQVVFAGGESKVPECLSLASVVVSSNTQKPESFGLSMAEALMMDRPVVAQAFGGALDVVRDGTDGVLVPAGEADPAAAFAAAIDRAAGTRWKDLREGARRRFDFDIMKRKTLETYEELVRM